MWRGVSIPPYFIPPAFNSSTQCNQPLQLLSPPFLLFIHFPPRTTTHFPSPSPCRRYPHLASEGLRDNLWDEDVLNEVLKFYDVFKETDSMVDQFHILRRRAPTSMLSELVALCLRQKGVGDKNFQVKSTKQIIARLHHDLYLFSDLTQITCFWVTFCFLVGRAGQWLTNGISLFFVLLFFFPLLYLSSLSFRRCGRRSVDTPYTLFLGLDFLLSDLLNYFWICLSSIAIYVSQVRPLLGFG